MESTPKQQARQTAAAMRHLVRRNEAAREDESLTPLQWTALQYFSMANSLSRTVSGFACYNATSRGTASQVIKQLDSRGYVHRLRNPDDGRSADIRLTGAGEALLAGNSAAQLFEAIEELPDADRQFLDRVVQRLIRSCRGSGDVVSVGTCRDCRCLQRLDGQLPYCRRADRMLHDDDLDALCIIHEPGNG